MLDVKTMEPGGSNDRIEKIARLSAHAPVLRQRKRGAVTARDFSILPDTKVADLLDRYPELEDVLISLASPFKKLKNPVLRKGVARVASLTHVAAVAGMQVNDLVNKLRA